LETITGLLIGADDYVVKPFAPDELVARVQRLLGRSHAPSQSRGLSRLTKRELEVLGLLAEGKSQPDIADELVISLKTVGTHIEHILSKLGVKSRAQAVALAYRDRLLEA
jgi:DNA-binding NarL/FixJ family response regulator